MSAAEAGLPKRCPSWCHQGAEGHQQAFDEGCTVEQASLHSTWDLIGSAEIHGWGNHWDLDLVSQPVRSRFGLPVLRLETRRGRDNGGIVADTVERGHLELTTGAARVLARQLLHLADLADLES